MKTFFTFLCMSSILILCSNQNLKAQCSGNVTLSTQAQVNAFTCTSFTGTLIIEDDNDGVDNIVTLDPINVNGMTMGNSAIVTGDLIVRNCDNLSNIGGLDGIIEIQGDFIQEDNVGINAPVPFSFSLTEIGGSFIFRNNPNANDVNYLFSVLDIGGSVIIENNASMIFVQSFNTTTSIGGNLILKDNASLINLNGLFLDALQTIGGSLILENNDDLASWIGIPTLTSVGSIRVDQNDNLAVLQGFGSLTTLTDNNPIFWVRENNNLTETKDFDNLTNIDGLGSLFIENNSNLVSVNDFNNLSDVHTLHFQANASLTNMPTFPSVTDVSGNFLLNYNSAISDYPEYNNITSIDGSLSIQNGSDTELSGFSGLSTVGGNFTIEDMPDLTSVTAFPILGLIAGDFYLINNSSLSDCCWAQSLIDITLGTISISGNATGCESQAAIGGAAPDLTCVPDFSVDVAPGTCSADVTMTDPTPIDDCDALTSYTIDLVDANGTVIYNAMNAVPGLVETLTLPAGENIYTYTATDENGNVSTCETIVTVVDNEAPILSPVPNNVTIFCNDVAPAPPVLTAADQCAGDISGDIMVTENSIFGNCQNGTLQEEKIYTYTIDDGNGNVSTATWTLFIENDFEVDLGPDLAVCDESSVLLDAGAGSSFIWSTGETTQMISVFSTGTYSVDVISNNGCCEADDIDVFFGTAPNASAIGAELDCSGNDVQLTGNSATANVDFSWTGPGGFTSNDQDPLVSEVGTYTLTVTDANGCAATATAAVTANTDVPDITAEGGTISCAVTSVELMSNSSVTGVSYAWTGPAGFMSSVQNPTVSATGTYAVVVTAPNGCLAAASVEVIDDTAIPSATTTAGMLSCGVMTTQIMTAPSADAVGFSWTGPDGFSSTDEDPTVSEVGMYTLEITASNGCTATTTIMVTGDFSAPNASAVGGVIDCMSTQTQLMGNSTTADVSYLWVGPNGFTSILQNPPATDPGTYTLTVTALNGCTSSSTAEVQVDESLPQITGVGGTIDCNNGSVQMMGSSTTANVTLSWTGPNGFLSDEMNPTVSIPGTYILTVEATNGCTITQTVLVEDDTAQPDIQLSLGDVNCDAGTRQIVAEGSSADLNISWTGPNGFSSSEISPFVSEAGTYVLETAPSNGCNSTHSIELQDNVAYEQSITTTPTGEATIMITSGVGPFDIAWDNGDTGITATELTDGPHTVTVTDGLGCTETYEFIVELSTATFDQAWINQIKVFPNPTSNVINIQLSENVKYFRAVELYNVNGKSIRRINLDASDEIISVNVSEWTAGIYFARIVAESSSHAIRFKVN